MGGRHVVHELEELKGGELANRMGHLAIVDEGTIVLLINDMVREAYVLIEAIGVGVGGHIETPTQGSVSVIPGTITMIHRIAEGESR